MTMIYESYPWKKDLQRQKKFLMKYKKPLHFVKNHDVGYMHLEKAIFFSAFIIRKLIDCGGKLSEEAEKYTLSIYGIEPLKPVDQLSRWPEDGSHDWDNEKKISISGKVICNSLIHSFLFFITHDENEFIDDFYVSSDFDRNKVLYRVPLDEWLKYIDYIVADDVIDMTIQYNRKLENFIYTRKKRGKSN